MPNSPNSLNPNRQERQRHKKFYYMLFSLLFLIVAILVYNIHIAPQKNDKEQNKQVEIQENNLSNMVLADGSGLATPLGEKDEQISGIVSPQNNIEKKEEIQPIVIIRDNPPEHKEENKKNEELEQIKKIRTQDFLSALKSPIISKQFKNEEQTQNQQIEEQSQNQTNEENSWVLAEKRTKGNDFEIKTGSVIPAVMITEINSDLAGNIIAQVSQHIFDSTTGQNLLIPQGAKLFGTYDSEIIYGQNRVLVSWNRIIFPDGSSLTLPAMPGADMGGSSGFKDRVNNHYFRTFSSAILMSLIVGGTAYAVDGSSSENENSLQSQMTSSLAQQLGETSANLLEKNLNIKPTLEVRTGYQFNIVLTKDLVFESPYTAWR